GADVSRRAGRALSPILYTDSRFRPENPRGEVAESAEGSRLLSGYTVKSRIQGSNPCLSAIAPLAQLDRASDYESEGRGFDSLRAHHHLARTGGSGVEASVKFRSSFGQVPEHGPEPRPP